MKSQVQYCKTQFSLLLIHLSSQILKICEIKQSKRLCKFIDLFIEKVGFQIGATNL